MSVRQLKHPSSEKRVEIFFGPYFRIVAIDQLLWPFVFLIYRMKIHHLNCLKIVSPLSANVIGHCLLLEADKELALVDTGLGLLDYQQPESRIGQALIDQAGFRLSEEQTAFRQIEKMGLDPSLVKNCILSHLDPDHAGGLADFPNATVHVSSEELNSFLSGDPRYLPQQLAHQPTIKTYGPATEKWFGLEARKIEINAFGEVYLTPLFGHTNGHSGVALRQAGKWLWYIGDAYYVRGELSDARHPVAQLSAANASNPALQQASLQKIRSTLEQHHEISVFGYHDAAEWELYAN